MPNTYRNRRRIVVKPTKMPAERSHVRGSILWLFLTAAATLACVLAPVPSLAESQEAAGTTNPFAGKPEAITEGRALYIKHGCSGCHGVMGGGGMAAPLTDDNWKFGDSDEVLFKLIKGEIPESTMPKLWQSLEADEIWKILAYTRSLRRADGQSQTTKP